MLRDSSSGGRARSALNGAALSRRAFAAGLFGASSAFLAGCAALPDPIPAPHRTGSGPSATPKPVVARPTPSITPTPQAFTADPGFPKQPFPAPGTAVYQLPAPGNFMAWTVDDGASVETVAAYAHMAATTGTRLTFFANGTYSSWSQAADVLRPLVASGQVVVGNHTFDHTALTKVSDAVILSELQRNDDYLTNLFGVSPKPFYRPPYGYFNKHVGEVAASIGYTVPVMWYGSLSDSGLITTDQVLQFANQWFLAGHIVIGHANFPPVTQVFPQLLDILKSRNLQTVTMRDVYA